MSEPLSLRDAIETFETLTGRAASPGDVAAMERFVHNGVTIGDLVTILSRDVPEPEAGEHRYEAQGGEAVPIP